MKLRYPAFGVLGATLVLTLILASQTNWGTSRAPDAIAVASNWQPVPLRQPSMSLQTEAPSWSTIAAADKVIWSSEPPEPLAYDRAFLETASPVVSWSGTLSSGETLDALLSAAGLSAGDRAEVALAMAAEYDLRKAVFTDETATRRILPEPDLVLRAADTTVQNSISATLASADVPARFAVDLAEMLGGTVDFRRDLKGDEPLQLMWREARLSDQIIGQPHLSFAALTIDETRYEIVWPDDNSGNATIFVDGEVLRVFAQPVKGARLSSYLLCWPTRRLWTRGRDRAWLGHYDPLCPSEFRARRSFGRR